jgi:hypothetical protein
MIVVLVVGATMAALTWALGWWAVVLVASIVGYVRFREGGGGWRVALAAAAAWGVLLVVDAVAGPFGTVTRTLAGVLRVPGPVLILLTLVFPALLAWSSATLVAGARRLVAARGRR